MENSNSRPGQCRFSALGFALHARECLPSASPSDMPIRQQNAERIHKLEPIQHKQLSGTRRLIGEVVKQWPVDNIEIEAAKLSLVSGYSFYQEHVRSILSGWRKIELNGREVSLDQLANSFDFDGIWQRVRVIFINAWSDNIAYFCSLNTAVLTFRSLIEEMHLCASCFECFWILSNPPTPNRINTHQEPKYRWINAMGK
jgi:hypothetical protein